MRALVVLKEKPSEVSLKAFLREHGLLAYVMARAMVVFVNGRPVDPSEVGLITVSPKDEIVVLPMVRGG